MGYNSPWREWLLSTATIITNNEIRINGQKIPNPPCELNNITIINNKVYVDGYEYKHGVWKKTLAALWHKYF